MEYYWDVPRIPWTTASRNTESCTEGTTTEDGLAHGAVSGEIGRVSWLEQRSERNRTGTVKGPQASHHAATIGNPDPALQREFGVASLDWNKV